MQKPGIVRQPEWCRFGLTTVPMITRDNAWDPRHAVAAYFVGAATKKALRTPFKKISSSRVRISK
jgi:hypothetical protein